MKTERRLPIVSEYMLVGKRKYRLVEANVYNGFMHATYQATGSIGPHEKEYIEDVFPWKEYIVETF